MKKLTLSGYVFAAIVFASCNASADVTASATASWDASASKDTISSLVVTPMKSLNFQYSEGLEAFNTQEGAFDISIQGQSGATDFMLTSKLISSTLTRNTDDSTLEVGVSWNGEPLSKSIAVTMFDTANNVTAGLDSLALSSAYTGTARTTAHGAFNFSIASATSDGSTSAPFKELNDGYWDGDVRVQFTAVWTVPVTSS
ncbi:fimbrial protein [Mixta theicola]|uniref:Common pilus major fimbrillin subunit EcpA n=1 Tax=Mixta theicola TaxID=1458355 RepID=A0A2K1QCN0_9GAMM|nr:common pilus major fimbrillin subunit EcpA [Mixta theicola]PNS12784.1 fimbrial protein [Mixta theicola]GLR10100.1 fimbrial protein [Mixta theicola]